MLDWIFEGMVDWVSRTVTRLMDAISGLFLNALGTEMTAMEEYFPFVAKAFLILQYTAWALLFITTVWQLFRAFSGPLAEAENPVVLIVRAAIFAFLIGYAKPVFLFVLQIAKAPYSALMDVTMGAEDFTFAGVEKVLKSGLITFISSSTVVGSILIIILMIALGWNYFKLLLEVVERYVIVGVLCYTSPLAYAMGASKSTSQVFKSWCRMIGAQLILLVLNVWFLRAFNSSIGQYVGNGGALSNGYGNIFLWLFCALAFLKIAQKFDSYLSSIGFNVAQTGSGLGIEMLMAMRMVTGVSRGLSSAGGIRGGGAAMAGAGAATGFAGSFADRFKGNSYVRDAVVNGGKRMGAGGAVGFFGRMIGGIAARNGATLNTNSIASVADRLPQQSGGIAGGIADKSLGNYMPHLKGKQLEETQITGGHISTKAIGANGQDASLNLYNASQFDNPNGPHSVVTAADGSKWYQTAQGAGAKSFYDAPNFTGSSGDSVSAAFPSAPAGTTLRTVDPGVMEANSSDGNSLWYNSAYYTKPDAPHQVITSANGVDWYAMKPNSEAPAFEAGEAATEYNRAQFKEFMPGYERQITTVDASGMQDGRFEVRHEDGSGTMFYDANRFAAPRSAYQTYENSNGEKWYATFGEASVERRPVYEDGKPVYDGDSVKSVSVESVRYRSTPQRFEEPKFSDNTEVRAPNRKK